MFKSKRNIGKLHYLLKKKVHFSNSLNTPSPKRSQKCFGQKTTHYYSLYC